MADFLTPFDPTTAASGTLPVQMSNGGWLMIHNISPTLLSFKVGIMTAPVLLPAFTARSFSVPLASTLISWTKLATLTSFGVPISQVYIEAYQPNEWNGGELYLPLAQSENPQPRVIAAPPSMQQWFSGTGVLGAAGTTQVLGAISLSALNKANQRGEAYLSKFKFDWVPPGAANGFAALQLDWAIRNSGGGVLGSIPIMPFDLWGTGQTPPHDSCSEVWPMPLSWDVSLPANSDNIALRVTMIAITAACIGASFQHHSVWWLDLNNSEPIASPGNAAQHVVPNQYY